MYYGLTNYYQNHRRYVRSRDDDQLLGESKQTANSLNGDCSPYQGLYNTSVPGDPGVPYAPCGAIANSLFNGTIYLSIYLYRTTSIAPYHNLSHHKDASQTTPTVRRTCNRHQLPHNNHIETA